MYGLLLNIHSWNHLIHKVDFDCATDRLACVHIMNGKKELVNNRIETLLGRLLDQEWGCYWEVRIHIKLGYGYAF